MGDMQCLALSLSLSGRLTASTRPRQPRPRSNAGFGFFLRSEVRGTAGAGSPPQSPQQQADYTPRLASVPGGHSAGQTALHKRHRSFALQPSGVATGSADAGVGSPAETVLSATSTLPPIVRPDRRWLARGLRSAIVAGLGPRIMRSVAGMWGRIFPLPPSNARAHPHDIL